MKHHFRKPCLAISLLAGTSAFAQTTDPEGCSFRGELLRADNFSEVTVFRPDTGEALETYAHFLLFPGDQVMVRGGQKVFVRDAPRTRPRVITAADSPFTIASPATCEVDPGMWGNASRFLDIVTKWAGGPVVALPVTTYARGDSDEPEFEISFGSPQLFPKGIDVFALHWLGPADRLQLVTNDGQVMADQNLAGEFSTSLALTPSFGDGFQLTLSSNHQQQTVGVERLPDDAAPGHQLFGSLADMSEDARLLYALWLLENGAPEWYLLAYTLISEQSEGNYMAWKLWRNLVVKSQ